jgi:virulence factor Mce-like protein
VKLTETGAEATLTLDTSPKIPADLKADVLSVSAVGEQYVDLRPRTDSGPYLRDGSVIAVANTTIPQQVGPMLDQVSALVKSIPKDRISDLLDESYKAFNGAGEDFQSLLDSSSSITKYLNDVSDQSRALINDSGPLLDSQAETTDSIRTWARSLAGVTQQVAQNDPQVRAILQQGPGFAQEVSGLLTQVKPTLPVLLANLTTLVQILVTYNPSLEQLLVMLPAVVAAQQAFDLTNNPTLPQAGTPRSPSAIRHRTIGSCRRAVAHPADVTTRHAGGCTPPDPPRAARNHSLHGTPVNARPQSNSATIRRGFSRYHARTRTDARRPESDRARRPPR